MSNQVRNGLTEFWRNKKAFGKIKFVEKTQVIKIEFHQKVKEKYNKVECK